MAPSTRPASSAKKAKATDDRHSGRASAGRGDRAAGDGGRPGSRPLSSVMISFGLVTIPVELRSATKSLAPAFHLVHQSCGSRIHQQFYCPVHKRVVERSELVRGFDVGKDEYVVFTPEELEHLDGEASRTIDIAEFVPLATVDPVYFETTYYLAPGKAGEKAYALLKEVMDGDARIALATFVMRGKENLVAIRADSDGLILHTLFFADEVRARPTLPQEARHSRPEEVKLARRLVDELASPTFTPDRYTDAYRSRVLEAARTKARGKTIAIEPPAARQAAVVNIMDALKASLERRKESATRAGRRSGGSRLSRKAS
jgi:DNA end-binding protein Ku